MVDTIVAGIDDSDGARHALSVAAELAQATGATLRVVHAYEFDLGWIEAGNPELPLWQQRAYRTAEESLHRVVTEVLGDDFKCEEQAIQGPPAEVLFDAARDADFLVVGTRGRGGFTSLLLGSVSQRLTQHAPCPVVVVPPARET
jgi:nucleotide-binding universal stress UspA family protein